MTHDNNSALLDRIAQLQAGPSGSILASLFRMAFQDLIEAELTSELGAGRYERSEGRTAHRNGHRPKTISTQAGDIELKIPKLSAGSFFPALLERRRRIDTALYAVIMEAYVLGISTRKVDDLVKALGIDSGISKSEVSRICQDLDVKVAEFRDRQLGEFSYPYIWLDATYCKVRVGGHVISQAMVVAIGMSSKGERAVLGTDVGDSESYEFWNEFLGSLKTRGLRGVHLVTSDAHAGLKAAVAHQFTGAAWQRCRVHFMRNLMAKVTKAQMPSMLAAFKTIFAATDPKEVEAQWDAVQSMFETSFPKAAELMADAKADVLAFTAFPQAHWQKVWSNNPIERLNKEIKRRSNVVEIFPNQAAFLRLATMVVIDQHDEWQAGKRYVSDTSMTELRAVIAAKRRAVAQAAETTALADLTAIS